MSPSPLSQAPVSPFPRVPILPSPHALVSPNPHVPIAPRHTSPCHISLRPQAHFPASHAPRHTSPHQTSLCPHVSHPHVSRPRARCHLLQDVCADCQQIVTLLTRMANESATKGFLRRECAALPVPSMVPPCQNLVHEYFSLLLIDLEGHLPWGHRCGHLHGHKHGHGWEPIGPSVGASMATAPPLVSRVNACPQVAAGKALPIPLPLCWLCRTFLARAEAAIPKEAVAEAATKLCRVLPVVVVGACQCLVQRYGVLLVEGVLGRLAPRLLCRLLLTCGPEDGYAPSSPPRQPLGAAAAPPAACAGPGTGPPPPHAVPKPGTLCPGPDLLVLQPRGRPPLPGELGTRAGGGMTTTKGTKMGSWWPPCPPTHPALFSPRPCSTASSTSGCRSGGGTRSHLALCLSAPTPK
uniref:Surfactant protein B n=1 Tax=Aquila chrysaetos chrysaetos TaxID=223781 RepID=A0A663EB39_AQUCH